MSVGTTSKNTTPSIVHWMEGLLHQKGTCWREDSQCGMWFSYPGWLIGNLYIGFCATAPCRDNCRWPLNLEFIAVNLNTWRQNWRLSSEQQVNVELFDYSRYIPITCRQSYVHTLLNLMPVLCLYLQWIHIFVLFWHACITAYKTFFQIHLCLPYLQWVLCSALGVAGEGAVG